MTPALAAAYVAIAAILYCLWTVAWKLRRAREVIAQARVCLLVDDDVEAYQLLSDGYEDTGRPLTLHPRLSRVAGHL